MSEQSKDYFRANALLVGRLVKLDILHYTSSNIAVLTAVFLTSIKNNEHFIAVRISGDKAETIVKQNPIDSWFEIQGG